MYEQVDHVMPCFDWDDEPVCYCIVDTTTDGGIVCGRPKTNIVKVHGQWQPVCEEHLKYVLKHYRQT